MTKRLICTVLTRCHSEISVKGKNYSNLQKKRINWALQNIVSMCRCVRDCHIVHIVPSTQGEPVRIDAVLQTQDEPSLC